MLHTCVTAGMIFVAAILLLSPPADVPQLASVEMRPPVRVRRLYGALGCAEEANRGARSRTRAVPHVPERVRKVVIALLHMFSCVCFVSFTSCFQNLKFSTGLIRHFIDADPPRRISLSGVSFVKHLSVNVNLGL